MMSCTSLFTSGMLPVSAVLLCAHILKTAEGSSLELGYSLDTVFTCMTPAINWDYAI